MESASPVPAQTLRNGVRWGGMWTPIAHLSNDSEHLWGIFEMGYGMSGGASRVFRTAVSVCALVRSLLIMKSYPSCIGFDWIIRTRVLNLI